MNHCVPDFEMDGDCSLPSLTRPRKSNLGAGDEIMELLWQNGPVVMQSQRSGKKSEYSEYGGYELIAADQATPSDILNQTHHHHQQQQEQQQQQNLFMQEDEMASWLHYPLNDTSFVADFCPDLLDPSPCVNVAVTAAATTTSTVSAATATRTAPVVAELRQQPPPKPPMPMPPPRRFENFGHFSSSNRPRVDESGPSISSRATNESTVVESSGTPAMGLGSRVSEALQYDVSRGTVDGGAAALATSSADGGGREIGTCELTVTSSPDASSACAEPPPPQTSSTLPPPPEDRKRKGIEIDAEADADECHSEDIELESADTKKEARGSTSTKRSRAAEVHNLSERRRRDRINEKMRALQELIPHCNKADKASMLDEAIDYLKSLQMQVQMMSMGCSVVPMMFPGVHQYMPHMGMGIGMAMGMDMGMSRPMLPFPNMLSGSAVPTPAAGAHLGPRFPIPTFHMPHVPAPDPTRISPTVQSDPLLSSLALPSQNQARIPNFIDPYQQYFGLRHMQLPLQQNQTPSGTSKPSTSKVGGNLENPPSG